MVDETKNSEAQPAWKEWLIPAAIAAVVVIGFLFYQQSKKSSATPAPIAAAGPSAAAMAACEGASFSACVINKDGETCSDDMVVARMIKNGMYKTTNYELNSKGACVITVHIEGVAGGNSYNEDVKVWGHK